MRTPNPTSRGTAIHYNDRAEPIPTAAPWSMTTCGTGRPDRLYQVTSDIRNVTCGNCRRVYRALVGGSTAPATPTAADLLGTVRHLVAIGLGSPDPKHWEAALQDISTAIGTDDEPIGADDPLIAAAPELRDALAQVLRWIDAGCDPSRKSIAGARALLARLGVTL